MQQKIQTIHLKGHTFLKQNYCDVYCGISTTYIKQGFIMETPTQNSKIMTRAIFSNPMVHMHSSL